VTASLDTPAGVRRCALALHALHPHDREWMLGRLDGRAAQDVRGLLAELAELGLPQDRAIVEQALARDAAAPACDPQAWASALSREPVGLVALAVRELPGHQRDAVLQHMGITRERQVKQRLQEQRRAGPHAPRLKQAIDAALREQLAAAVPPAERSLWKRAWRRWRGARA
jgi:hypothetical protein